MPLCGAKTRQGGMCKRHALEGKKRCRLHGGISSPGNQHAKKPGSIYSKFLTPDEQAIVSSLSLGGLEDELRLTKIRLMRALKAEKETPELDEITERFSVEKTEEGITEEKKVNHEQKFRRIDYPAIIDKCTARIASLEKQRLELVILQKQVDGKSDDDGIIKNTVIIENGRPLRDFKAENEGK